MNPEILDYIKEQRIGVLAVEMLDGSPHGATLHFAINENPFTFIFLTSRNYRKSESLLKNGKTRASFVVGVDEESMKTFQSDGQISITDDQEIKDAYFGKFPKKREKYNSSEDLFLVFTSTWWRFTDWTKPKGKTIILSTDLLVS